MSYWASERHLGQCLNKQTRACAGPERVKEALAALGMKSGGTLRQRAERLFLTRDTPLAQLDRKHFAKGAAPAAVRSADENARISAAAHDTALLEAKVGRRICLLNAALFQSECLILFV